MPKYNFYNLGIRSNQIEKGSLEELTLLFLGGPKRTISDLVKAHAGQVGIRGVYQIIRNLRDAGCPIVGDSGGVWIAKNESEVESFARRLEHKAKSDIQSMTRLRKTMLSMIKSKTPSLFDSIIF